MITQTIKGKYEAILGFVTLIISLSAFKQELREIPIDIGILQFSVADYFLCVIYGFCLCLYCYVVEFMVRDFSFGTLKIFDYITYFAFFLFVLVLCSPFLLLFSIVLFKIYLIVPSLVPTLIRDISTSVISAISAILMLAAVRQMSDQLLKQSQTSKLETLETDEIISIERARMLFIDGYYSQSLLESFKALNYHLYKQLLNLQVRVSPNRFFDLVREAKKHQLIKEEDISLVADIHGGRNAVAHSNTGVTKELSERALKYVSNLIQNAA